MLWKIVCNLYIYIYIVFSSIRIKILIEFSQSQNGLTFLFGLGAQTYLFYSFLPHVEGDMGWFLFIFLHKIIITCHPRRKKKKEKEKEGGRTVEEEEEEFSSSFLKGQLKSYTLFLFYEEVIREILHKSIYIHWFSFFGLNIR